MKKILYALFLASSTVFFQPAAYFMYSEIELQAIRDGRRMTDAVVAGDLQTCNQLLANYNSNSRPDVLSFLITLAKQHGQTAIIDRLTTVATQHGAGEKIEQFVALIEATEKGNVAAFTELFTTLRAQIDRSFIAALRRIAIAKHHTAIVAHLDSSVS